MAGMSDQPFEKERDKIEASRQFLERFHPDPKPKRWWQFWKSRTG